jgi:DegV family protein with EDD domain
MLFDHIPGSILSLAHTPVKQSGPLVEARYSLTDARSSPISAGPFPRAASRETKEVPMAVKIVTDSTCDLPQALLEKYGITVIPLYVNFGPQSYLDGIELSRRQFYEMLARSDAFPTTAVPGLPAFSKVYEDLAAQGADQILSVHIASTLSATCDVARKAAEQTESIPVTVFDARQVTVGTGLAVIAAAEAAREGKAVSDIVSLLEDMVPRIHSYAALDTVEFLRRSGRLTAIQYGLSTVLDIKPLIMMHNGELGSERVRTGAACIRRMIELVTDLGRLEQLALVHTNAPRKAEELYNQTRHLFPSDEAPLSVEVTPIIGAHVGPNAVGMVAVAERA